MARLARKDRGLFQRRLKDGTKVWAVRLSVNGKLTQFSPFPTKAQARTFYDNSKASQRQGRFFPDQHHLTGPTIQSFLDRYLLTIANKKSARVERPYSFWWGVWYEGEDQWICPTCLAVIRRTPFSWEGYSFFNPRVEP